MDLAGYHEVTERIGEATARAGRDVSDITLVAVSKGRSVGEIEALYSEGHRDFGENRAGEMAGKVAQLPEDIRWHFVGNLQSNKARAIRASTHLLHSVDRGSLAKAWVKGMGQPPPILIQVNIGNEEQKGGVEPDRAADLIGEATDLGLDPQGLMAIPPLGEIPEDSRRFFVALRELRAHLSTEAVPLGHLSMGMTNDFEVAIEEGASIIRVGRAIFGSTH